MGGWVNWRVARRASQHRSVQSRMSQRSDQRVEGREQFIEVWYDNGVVKDSGTNGESDQCEDYQPSAKSPW